MDISTNISSNQSIEEQLGVPPVPPMPSLGDAPELSPVDAMAAELSNAAPEPIAPLAPKTSNDTAAKPTDDAAATLDALVSAPAATEAAAAPATQVAAEAAPVADGELDALKKSILKDLFPLMDKVNVTPVQRFRIYREVIEDSGNKSLITPAYETAKVIEDETAKAEALLFLVEAADK